MGLLSRLLLSLIAGTAIAVVIAWLVAALWPIQSRAYRRTGAEHWPVPRELPVAFDGPDVWVQQSGPLTRLQLLYRGRNHAHVGTMVYVALAGFPFRCLAAESDRIVDIGPDGFVTEPSWRSGIAVPESLRAGPLPRSLPLVPLPLGLSLNSLVYAVFAFFCPRGWRILRAPHRRRASRCILCGHPLVGQAICPECGSDQRRWPA